MDDRQGKSTNGIKKKETKRKNLKKHNALADSVRYNDGVKKMAEFDKFFVEREIQKHYKKRRGNKLD